MNVRSLILVVGVAGLAIVAPVAAHAQTGLYVNPVAMRIGSRVADTGTFAFLGPNSTSQWFYGVNFGAYHDFQTPLPFKVGVDVRESILHGSGAVLESFLAGGRISGRPFRNHTQLKPYFEPVVGAATTRAPFTDIHVTRLQYGFFAGLDYQTHHHVDFRLIEVGGGPINTVSSSTSGGSQIPVPYSGSFSLSTGIVFRFP